MEAHGTADERTVRRLALVLSVVLAGFGCALARVDTAAASQLIARNATGVSIKTNAKGEAVFTFRVGGKTRHVLVWGALNAKSPTPGSRQVEFKVDYSGGWRARHTTKFAGSCGRYDGPVIPDMVAVS